jgi:hypothetical protein
MDEQLKQELVKLLQEARESIPPAVETLIEQISGYYGVLAGFEFFVLVCAVLASYYFFKMARTTGQKWNDLNAAPSNLIIGTVTAAVGLVTGLMLVNHVAKWLYPLGNLI